MRMLGDGKSKADIARHLGVSKSAIGWAAKQAQRRMELVPSLNETGDSAGAMIQIRKINNLIIEEINRIMRLITREDIKIQDYEKLEDEFKINPQNTELAKKLSLRGFDMKTILEMQKNVISLSAESRHHIELQLKIAETLYNIAAAEEFRQEILQAIGEVDTKVRDAIIKNIKERRTLRGLVKDD